jgi:aminopeptidase-like protein
LSYGEYFHRGHSPREFLFTAHICHPSLANDNCSGLALLTTLASKLKGRQTRFSYRFLFAPGTIGALAWLAANETRLHRIAGGLVVSCVGDSGGPTYKKSRQGKAIIDRAMEKVILRGREDATIKEFVPYGYDERQFCSPGFDLPMGLFQRSAFGTFPEYHTSADNMDFISADNLNDSFNILMQIIDINENNWTPFSLCPKGEPQLGRRGLYGSVGGDSNIVKDTMPLLWVLNLADGEHSLLDIAERSGYSFSEISAAARILQSSELLTEISEPFASD